MVIYLGSSDARQTKYTQAVIDCLNAGKHLSNNQLLERLRLTFPEISATTVHRITLRLSQRGVIGLAPATINGFLRYDANIKPHDHFVCLECDQIKDLDIKQNVMPYLKAELNDCDLKGRITISGVCRMCK